MKRTIKKQLIKTGGIEVPSSAKLLKIGSQNGDLMFWYSYLQTDIPPEQQYYNTWHFQIVKTDSNYDTDRVGTYIGSIDEHHVFMFEIPDMAV